MICRSLEASWNVAASFFVLDVAYRHHFDSLATMAMATTMTMTMAATAMKT
jgi:hypothetical protein